MAGYGLKAFLIAQSLNQIEKAYGPNNAILDNCHAHHVGPVVAGAQREDGLRRTQERRHVYGCRYWPRRLTLA